MLHGVEFEQERVHALVRSSGGDVGVPTGLAAAARRRPPWPPPGEKVLLQGGYDLLRDLLADLGLAGHRSSSRYPAVVPLSRSTGGRGFFLSSLLPWNGEEGRGCRGRGLVPLLARRRRAKSKRLVPRAAVALGRMLSGVGWHSDPCSRRKELVSHESHLASFGGEGISATTAVG